MSKDTKLKASALYALQTGKKYKIAKILAVNDLSVHLRVYAEVYEEVPKNLDSSKLSLNNLDISKISEMTDEEIGNSMGMGHIPVNKEAFAESKKIFLRQETLEEYELEGYYYYLNN